MPTTNETQIREAILADPTLLTTQQLQREIATLKELMDARFETRLNAMDKAMNLFHDNITRVPTDTDKQISHLKELHERIFDAVWQKFADQEKAVAAAMTSAKEAILVA